MTTKVSAVLEHKGHNVITVAPHDTVGSLVEVLSVNRIGAAPVVNQDHRLVGIVSERDVIRCMAQHREAVMTLPVERVMTLQRIRHLPVIQDGALKGIVSIGDVVKQRLHEAQSELDELRNYICSSS